MAVTPPENLDEELRELPDYDMILDELAASMYELCDSHAQVTKNDVFAQRIKQIVDLQDFSQDLLRLYLSLNRLIPILGMLPSRNLKENCKVIARSRIFRMMSVELAEMSVCVEKFEDEWNDMVVEMSGEVKSEDVAGEKAAPLKPVGRHVRPSANAAAHF